MDIPATTLARPAYMERNYEFKLSEELVFSQFLYLCEHAENSDHISNSLLN